MCPNYSPGVKLHLTLGGVATLTWAYIGKTLEISVYLAIRLKLTKFCMQLHLVDLYQDCPNYSPGVKFGPTPGVISFTLANIRKILEISLYFRNLRVTNHKVLAYQILHAASSFGPLPRVPKLIPWGQI